MEEMEFMEAIEYFLNLSNSGMLKFIHVINNDTSMRVVRFCTVAFRQTMHVVFTNTVAFSIQS